MSAASNHRLVALVPMRHHSERVPGKNYRLLASRPLYAYVLETLVACPEVEAIVVNTDSPEIQAGIAARFPNVVVLDRPEHLRADSLPINEVLAYDLTQVSASFYLQTHSTNPLLRPETIRAAIAAFFQAYPEKDSLFGVTRVQTRLWDGSGRPLNHDPQVLLRTQDLEPVFEENSCLYIFERELFLHRRNRLGQRPLMYEIASEEAWDIDGEWDLKVAEALLAR
ncbi:MAG: cytidylyltransferase domain-containing protein [Anaerolineales bacterium]